MQKRFTLLIADKNRNVRDFLRREFAADGYTVHVANDCNELMQFVGSEHPPDLLIFDLEMPYAGGPETLAQVQSSQPHLPVVVHSFLTDHTADRAVLKAAAVLEKKGTNVDSLKQVVMDVLKDTYPDRV
jgi:DNA-binding NtrC family response regulator